MKVLFKSVKVVDKHSKWNGQQVDVLISSGKVEKIAKKIAVTNIKSYEFKNACISPSFIDINASIPDPGMEQREDLNSGLNAAAAGGFSHIALMPQQNPTVQDKSGVEFIKSKTEKHICQPLIIGAMSKNREGKEMTEMYDMQIAGAVAYSDADKSVQDAGLMSRCLLYAKGINSFIMSFPEDHSLALGAKMNEGVMSTLLGMKGNPSLSEELMIARDLYIAEYQNAKIHFSNISSARSIELIKAAKKKGINVTADVTIHHLCYDETILEEFDTNFKLRPPLRTKQDVNALKAAVKEGIIDAISSQHTPIEKEGKEVEFEVAKYGMISFQTFLSQLISLTNKNLLLEDLIDAVTARPRSIFSLESVYVEEGSAAEFCIYDLEAKWKFDDQTNLSKSVNSNLYQQELKGMVLAIVANNQLKTY